MKYNSLKIYGSTRKNIQIRLVDWGRKMVRKNVWRNDGQAVLTDEQELAKLEPGERYSRELVWRQSGMRERTAFSDLRFHKVTSLYFQ